MKKTSTKGFTLIETIIYIGLFGLIFSGIFVSIYPLFSNAERLTKDIAVDGEVTFILAKIDYAISHTVVSASGIVTTPAEGTSADTLTMKLNGVETFSFAIDKSNTFCSPPLVCGILTISKNANTALPLNAERVRIENFKVTHTGPTNGEPGYLDVSFTGNGRFIGPVRYYLNF